LARFGKHGQALSGIDTTSRVESKASQELCDDDNRQYGYSGCGRDSSGYAHTVDAHLKHIYTKLDIHSRVELTVLALQHG